MVYLHLSRRHLHAAPNPLEQLHVTAPPVVRGLISCGNRRSREPARRGGAVSELSRNQSSEEREVAMLMQRTRLRARVGRTGLAFG